jgi:hypothetical protein
VYFGYYDTASFLRSSPLVGRIWGVEDVRAGEGLRQKKGECGNDNPWESMAMRWMNRQKEKIWQKRSEGEAEWKFRGQ